MKQKQNGNQQRQEVVVAAAVGYLLPAEKKKNSWSKPFENGQVRAIFYVEENPIRNSYRVLVANRFYRPEERQWWDADEIPKAIKTLKEVEKAYKKAKWHLEGGAIRRFIRWLF